MLSLIELRNAAPFTASVGDTSVEIHESLKYPGAFYVIGKVDDRAVWSPRLLDHWAAQRVTLNVLGIDVQTTPRQWVHGIIRDDLAWSVYLIRPVGGGPIKIGTSNKIKARIAALQTGSPVLLQLLGAIPGTTGLEGRLHERLRDHRVHGEWFHDCAAVRVEVAAAISDPAFVDPRPVGTLDAAELASVPIYP